MSKTVIRIVALLAMLALLAVLVPASTPLAIAEGAGVRAAWEAER